MILCQARKTGYQILQTQKKTLQRNMPLIIVGDNFFLLVLFCVFKIFNKEHKFSAINALKRERERRTQYMLPCFLLIKKMMCFQHRDKVRTLEIWW